MATQDPRPVDDAEREARLQRILREVEQQLRERLPNPLQPLEKTEREIVEIGRQVREVIERETLADVGSGYLGSHVHCPCGQPARFVRLNERHLVTLNGNPGLWRAYYHCKECRRGFCPLDATLGIGRQQSSVGVRALAARFDSYMAFGKAAGEMEIVTGVRLSASTMRREGIAVGEAFAAMRAESEQRLWAGCALPVAARPLQMHASMDGFLIRIGKEWREARLGAFFVTGQQERVEQIRYVVGVVNSVTFGRRMRTLGHEMGVSYCRKLGMVADGIDWIWQETAKHFPQSEEMLDFYHATQHLWAVARAAYGEGAAAQTWMDQQVKRLLKDEVGAVIAAVARWETKRVEDGELRRRTENYLRQHEHRMRYATFREAGFHIGSGVIEASGKSVIQMRMKGAGMRWGDRGADAMLHLRAAFCSTGSTDFLEPARRATLLS
jgi:hypothetical protein